MINESAGQTERVLQSSVRGGRAREEARHSDILS